MHSSHLPYLREAIFSSIDFFSRERLKERIEKLRKKLVERQKWMKEPRKADSNHFVYALLRMPASQKDGGRRILLSKPENASVQRGELRILLHYLPFYYGISKPNAVVYRPRQIK